MLDGVARTPRGLEGLLAAVTLEQSKEREREVAILAQGLSLFDSAFLALLTRLLFISYGEFALYPDIACTGELGVHRSSTSTAAVH